MDRSTFLLLRGFRSPAHNEKPGCLGLGMQRHVLRVAMTAHDSISRDIEMSESFAHTKACEMYHRNRISALGCTGYRPEIYNSVELLFIQRIEKSSRNDCSVPQSSALSSPTLEDRSTSA